MSRCRCFSRKLAKRCCGPYHAGRPAPDPQALMRSRYAAYASGLVDYIMATTDPQGPHWRHEEEKWRAEILAFCESTRFEGLRILEAPTPGPEYGSVSFRAGLSRAGQDVSFAEKSSFRLRAGRWYYVDGSPV